MVNNFLTEIVYIGNSKTLLCVAGLAILTGIAVKQLHTYLNYLNLDHPCKYT